MFWLNEQLIVYYSGNTQPATHPTIASEYSKHSDHSDHVPSVLCSQRGRHWQKKKLLTTGKKNKVHPYSPHWKKNLRHWKKIRICTLNLFAAEISYLFGICAGFGHLNMQLHGICCNARTILEPASVRRGLSAAFRVICNILSRDV